MTFKHDFVLQNNKMMIIYTPVILLYTEYRDFTYKKCYRVLHREIERVELSDCELLSACGASVLFGYRPTNAQTTEDVTAHSRHHLRASPFKSGCSLHADRTL